MSERRADRSGRALLAVDALVNLALGALLMAFPTDLVRALGLPRAASGFYPSVLGAVLIGIGIALLLELGRRRRSDAGLGLRGAVAINLSGGAVLAAWLVWGRLSLPMRGRIGLWVLVALLVVLSALELARASR